VRSGQNGFGAAGPMQIGIEGASGNTWGGTPIHQASQVVAGVATDENGDGTANVYDPPDAIAGAAKYLLEAGVQSNPSAAIFSYNHLQSYVQSVLMYAGQYAGGNFSVASAQLPAANSAAGCVQAAGGVPAVQAPTQAVATAISYAEQQLGKPYLWGGTGRRGSTSRAPRKRSGPARPGSPPPRFSPGTWCSSPARTVPSPILATSAWWSGTGR
jgi:cell wall-associated NlpC family hydrolase